MEHKVTTLDGKAGGSIALPDEIFGLEPRADILQRMVRWQLSKRQAGTHKTKTRGEIYRDDQEDVQAEGHRPRPPRRQVGAPVPRRRQGIRSGGPQPRSRSAQEGPRAGAEACPFRQGQERQADRHRRGERQGAEDQGARRAVREARLLQCADRRRRRGRGQFPPRGAQHPGDRRAAGSGHQRLRHPAARHAGPDQGGGRGA